MKQEYAIVRANELWEVEASFSDRSRKQYTKTVKLMSNGLDWLCEMKNGAGIYV